MKEIKYDLSIKVNRASRESWGDMLVSLTSDDKEKLKQFLNKESLICGSGLSTMVYVTLEEHELKDFYLELSKLKDLSYQFVKITIAK